MEWVETTAKSVDEAKELALDRLGVDEIDAEFEVLEAPRPGLFGRTRGEARVRARVRPTQPRPKAERRDRKRRSDKTEKTETSVKADTTPKADDVETTGKAPKADKAAKAHKPAASDKKTDQSGSTKKKGEPAAMSESNPHDPSEGAPAGPRVEDVSAEAVRFMDGLLGALGLDGTTKVVRDGTELEVIVDGANLGLLIGPRGSTLLAVQDLVRVASQRRLGDHDTRLRVDINGYREKRREALARFAQQQADEVAASGLARQLEPMPSADRKVIHDALIERDDVTTRSEGEDPARRVVIAPATAAE